MLHFLWAHRELWLGIAVGLVVAAAYAPAYWWGKEAWAWLQAKWHEYVK